MEARSYILQLAHDAAASSIISAKLAASALDVTRGTVERMLSDGRLTPLEVDGRNYVVAAGVVDLVRQGDKQQERAVQILEEVARNKQTITYRPIMEQLGLDYTLSRDRNVMALILDRASIASHGANKFLLSVLVRRKVGKQTGPGFFTSAKKLGYKWRSEKGFIEDQTKKVWEHYSA